MSLHTSKTKNHRELLLLPQSHQSSPSQATTTTNSTKASTFGVRLFALFGISLVFHLKLTEEKHMEKQIL